MAERDIRDRQGNGFTLKSFEYRSEPWTSPLTGRSIRCVVGRDENGAYRLARRTGRMGGERFEMTFAREAYATKDAAVKDSRAMKVDFIRGEAETWLEKKGPNNQDIFQVDCIEGWHRPEYPAEKMLDRVGLRKWPQAEPEREQPSRSRDRCMER